MKSSRLPVEKFEAIYREWEGRAGLGEDVARHLAERMRYLGLIAEAIASAGAEGNVLELGCGTAIDLCLLARRHPGTRFHGLDIARGSLALARRVSAHTGERIGLVRGDVFRLPFPAGTFSVVYHQGLVEHFPDPAGMMREQERVLRPGGRAVISVPQTFTGYTVMKRRRIRAGTWPWGWECHYTAGSLEALGRAAGLEPVGRTGEGYWRSWGEPAWVLRDLFGKLHRRNPLAGRAPFAAAHRAWERLWERLEEGLGHRFCKSVIVSFRKPARPERQ